MNENEYKNFIFRVVVGRKVFFLVVIFTIFLNWCFFDSWCFLISKFKNWCFVFCCVFFVSKIGGSWLGIFLEFFKNFIFVCFFGLFLWFFLIHFEKKCFRFTKNLSGNFQLIFVQSKIKNPCFVSFFLCLFQVDCKIWRFFGSFFVCVFLKTSKFGVFFLGCLC